MPIRKPSDPFIKYANHIIENGELPEHSLEKNVVWAFTYGIIVGRMPKQELFDIWQRSKDISYPIPPNLTYRYCCHLMAIDLLTTLTRERIGLL